MATKMADGYQIYEKNDDGDLNPVSRLFGSFREAVEERLRLASFFGNRFEIHAIINNNNSK